MLKIHNLKVKVKGEEILKGVSLEIPRGETHILLGPNGSGKTTLLKAIMGMGSMHTTGSILLDGEEISGLSIDERARRGVGLALQRSPAIPELTLDSLLQMIGNKFGSDGMEEKIDSLNCRYLLGRGVNENFSGGEMKRSEVLQLLVQEPKVVLVDEPESGVDLENIVVIGEALKRLLKPSVKEKKRAALIITHTGHILNYLNADKGYVLLHGRIICSGNPRDIFEAINRHGFEGCMECEKCN
ncbi:MAG: ABC transporter ATP-binding protein [Firmicutes bacterium]|nr:ABC transporter ATP-binding protein [Bacillota bacterium]